MQKILSIDLSFVMSPSLHLYEDWALGTWTDTHTQWEMLNSKMSDLFDIETIKREIT